MRRPLFALLLVALSATAASGRYRLMPEHAAELALADGQPITVLSHAQQQRAAELENDARKQMDEERARRGRDAGEGERRRRGGMDSPTEG